MNKFFILVLGLLCTVKWSSSLKNSEENDYDNYKVIQLSPKTDSQFSILQRFSDPSGMVEVMKPSRGVNDSMDLLVHPQRVDALFDFAENRRLNVIVKIKDLRKTLAADTSMWSRRSMPDDKIDLVGYNSYSKILQFQKQLAAAYPECVSVQEVGTSFQGKPMLLTKISKNQQSTNPVIFIDAGIHAREWVAPAMALYLMERISKNCRSSNENDSMLDKVDWFILPMANPDGYEFSRNKNRMWRKTRSRYVRSCHGVDGNRNYGFKWGSSGVSSNPCDLQTYPGPRPFSEQETRIIRDIMLENKNRIKLYVSLHAYGQYLVYPWGYTGAQLPERWQELHSLAQKVSDAVQKAGGEPFTVTSAGKWYAAAGGSDDYAFAVAKIPYSYTMELTNGYEFIYPERLLRKVLPEFYEGFKEFKEHIASAYGR